MSKKRELWCIEIILALLLPLPMFLAHAATPTFPIYVPFIAQTFISTTGNTAVSTIDIVNYEFQPSYGAQAAGATITWVNRGTTAHTVTFDNGEGDSGPIQPGQSFAFTLPDTVGARLTYHCLIHPGMTGIIDVLPANNGPPTPTPMQEEN